MRIKDTPSLAAVAVLAVAGTAVAATGTRNSVSTTMRGTTHIASGGKLTLTAARRPEGRRFYVSIAFDARMRSKTVLGFAVYPCRSTSCKGASTDRITLGSGRRRVKFHGSIPVVRTSSGRGCVYAQLRDLGPRGRAPGAIVRNGSLKGVSFCQSVK